MGSTGYVIPTVLMYIDGKPRGLEPGKEVEVITKLEEARGNRVVALAPFYYPIHVVKVADHYATVIDPLDPGVYRVNYAIPNLALIKDMLSRNRSDKLLFLLKELAYALHELSTKNTYWIPRAIVLSSIITKKTILGDIEKYSEALRQEKLNGIMLNPGNYDEYSSMCMSSVNVFLREVTKAYLELESIREYIDSLVHTWFNTFAKKQDIAIRELKRSLEAAVKHIDQRQVILDRNRDREFKRISDNYRAVYNDLKYKLRLISAEIDKIKNREKTLGVKYSDLLAELNRRKESISHKLHLLEKDSKRVQKELRKKYSILWNFEELRKNFLRKEGAAVLKEYSRTVNSIQYSLSRIYRYLDLIAGRLEVYRNRVYGLFIKCGLIPANTIYLKGYVVIGSKGKSVYTPLFIRERRNKMDKNIIKSFNKILAEKKAYQELHHISTDMIRSYNCLKRKEVGEG